MNKPLAFAAFALAATAPVPVLAQPEAKAQAQASAQAPIGGVDALKQWNLIVLGDLSSNQEVEGRTFVGGNLTGQSSNYSLRETGRSADDTAGLTVVGNVSGGTKNLQNSSGARVGGNVTSGFNLNRSGNLPSIVEVGGTLQNTNVNRPDQAITRINSPTLGNGPRANPTYDANFLPGLNAQKEVLSTSLLGLSQSLSTLSATPGSTLTFGANTATFNAVAGAGGYSVFSLSAAQLNSVGQIRFNRNGVDTVIVNVDGAAIRLDDNFLGNSSQLGQNVIWNFHNATSLTASTAFYGSVLAPRAAGTIGNFIEGSAVFGSLQQNGELHLGTFKGGKVPSFTSAVPEPATWAMMIFGFAGIGLAMRRRSAAAMPRAITA